MTKRRPALNINSNEWVTISWNGQHEQCCECGCRHIVDYRVVDGKLQFKARRFGERKTP